MSENAPNIVHIITLAAIAGLVSSVLGGIIAICISRPNKKFIGLSFVFVASVLITLVFVDFIPHAIGHGHYHTAIDPNNGQMYQYWYQHSGAGIWFTVLGVMVGVGLVIILTFVDKHGHEHVHGILPHNEHCSHNDEEETAISSKAKSDLTKSDKRRMIAVAFPIAFGIILHDLPKGLAIGSSGSLFAAIAIGLSCIPEGMSIALPLKAGGTKWWKVLGICGLAGLVTVVGAVIGYLVGGINVYLSGIMFAIAAGCILGVVFSEILPLAIEYSGRTKLKLPIMIVGVMIVITLNHFFHNLMH
ncbi:MAG: ZIP family metal transporter [Defluviitaleaceae bacterium]|nr:ZIP family metal transporter [Defluviitaleaceae bacterium]